METARSTLPLAALALAACSSPASVELGERLRDGRYTVDGVELPSSRRVELSSKLLGAFQYRTAAGDVELEGADVDVAKLEVVVYETRPGDAMVSFENGTISARSKTGHPVALAHLRGTIPRSTALLLSSDAGRLALHGFAGSAEIRIECGKGPVQVADVRGDSLRLRSGSAALEMRACRARLARVESDEGAIDLEDCGVTDLEARSAVGAIALRGGEYGRVSAESPEGTILFERCHAVSASARTVSGDVVARDASFVEPPTFRTVRGKLSP